MESKQNIEDVESMPVAFEVCLMLGHQFCLWSAICAVIDGAFTLAYGSNSDFSFIPLMLFGLLLATHAATTHYAIKRGWVQLPPNE